MRSRDFIITKLLGDYSVLPAMLLGLALRIININSPVLGVHSWRQADTASIARNFYANGMDFFSPQIDWGGASSGLVGSEFPLYSYLVALSYKIFGFSEILARGISVLFSCLTILLIYQLTKHYFGVKPAFWSALLYSFLPIPVYYGRTIQPEALMMFLAALSLERWLAFLKSKDNIHLFVSWLAFTLAVLVKAIPLIWLGLPILITAIQQGVVKEIRFNLLVLASLVLSILWYTHAYNLFQSTGLSFGIWGANHGRFSLSMPFQLEYWSNLTVRIMLRNLLILGFPLFILGAKPWRLNNIFILGLFSVLIGGAMNPQSFSVHEYYQLPMMLFFCPLMGMGVVRLQDKVLKNNLLGFRFLLASLLVGSIFMLQIDYWMMENKSVNPVWSNAKLIESVTDSDSLVVSVTGGDPTLLYLANRKGWVIPPESVNIQSIRNWKDKGANYISGSWQVIESYQSFSDLKLKARLRNTLCPQNSQGEINTVHTYLDNKSCSISSENFLIPLNNF